MACQGQPHAGGRPNLPERPGIILRTSELIRGICLTGAYFERLEDDPEPRPAASTEVQRLST